MGRRNKRKQWRKNLAAKGVEWVGEPKKQDTIKADNFKLIIPDRIFDKIMHWINKASPNEVSGFGSLAFDEETREFLVKDAYLLEQEVSGGSAEISGPALAKAMYERRDEDGALKWHWHSHPTFSVFWSGTDMELIRELGGKGWIVASVFNQKKECRTAYLTVLDLMGRPHEVFVDDFKTVIERPHDAVLADAADKEFAKYVKEKKWGIEKYEWSDDGWRSATKEIPPRKPWEHYASTKTEDGITYDQFGYGTIDGVSIYNPLKDSEIYGDDMLYSMISDMMPDEIDLLRKHDDKFAKVYREYIIDQAKSRREEWA